jgi:hypothetical protein
VWKTSTETKGELHNDPKGSKHVERHKNSTKNTVNGAYFFNNTVVRRE